MIKKSHIIIICIAICAVGMNFLFFKEANSASSDEVWTGFGTTVGEAGIKATAEVTPNDQNANVPILVGKIIGIILSFLGVIFLVLTIYGGFLWMLSSGNEEQLGKAKKIISSAAVGLALVLSAYAITWFVTTRMAINTGMVEVSQLNEE